MNWGKIYVDLLDKSYNRIIEEPTEKHHAYPWHWFDNSKKKDHDWSIVKLTRREHFIAHRLLCKIYPNCQKAHMALWRMLNTVPKRIKYKVNSKIYEKHKKIFIDKTIQYRKNIKKDSKRRKICSERMKELWKKGYYDDIVVSIRKDPVRDRDRREVCRKSLLERNKNGLAEETKKRNKNLNHMTKEQVVFLRKKQKESVLNKTQVIFLDGTSAKVTSEYYQKNKGITCFHASSKKAADILGKPYKGGRPKKGS